MAVLQALGIVGHNLATLSTKATHGPAEEAMFDAMRGFQFKIIGSTRSARRVGIIVAITATAASRTET